MAFFDRSKKKKKPSKEPEPTPWRTQVIDGKLYLLNLSNPKQRVLLKDIKVEEKLKQVLKETESKRLTTTQAKKLLDKHGIERTPDRVFKIKKVTKRKR